LKRFVLDASIALAWFIDRTIAPYAVSVRQLLQNGDRAVVPPLWQVEVWNCIVMAERRGIITASDTAELLQNLEVVIAQSIETSQEAPSSRRVVAAAREFRLTAYDAVYLDLAMQLQLPLATLDRALHHAATKAGIPLAH
jgi:predicted nucleic acid-binding protein